MIEHYDQLASKLYSGDVEDCFRFLNERAEADGLTAPHMHWRAVTHLRAGQFREAFELCCRITRESDSFGYQMHCLCDAAAHLGLKESALAMIEYFALRPSTIPIGAFLWRVYGWHYLGEDERVLRMNADGVDPHSAVVLGHHQARSAMRLHGIAHGVDTMQRYWSSHDARSVLFPDVNVEQYWCGQRALPAHMTITSIASGYGDMLQWSRYVGALQALGVQIHFDRGSDFLFRLATPEHDQPALAESMRAAGFTVASDGALWTEPFALFTALFPVVGYASAPRYIEPPNPVCADALIAQIRERAQGRRCVGLFWSSCESANNFANRSLSLPDLAPLLDETDDIHWVIMQRGFERNRWLADPRSRDVNRFTTLDPDTLLEQSIALIDRLDAFAGNDGGLSHAAGALGKPAYLFLNSVADWRYESAPHHTPWYPSMRLVRARQMGDWADVVRQLTQCLAADAR